MAISVSQFVELVYLRAAKGQPQATSNLRRDAVESLVATGDLFKKFAIALLATDDRVLLENDYPLTLAANVAAFSAATDLLPMSIPICDRVTHPSVVDTGSNILPFTPCRSALDLSLKAALPDSVMAFYFPGVSAVQVRWPGGSLGNTTLTVRAIQIPASLATIPVQRQELLADIAIDMLGGGSPQPQPQQPTQ